VGPPRAASARVRRGHFKEFSASTHQPQGRGGKALRDPGGFSGGGVGKTKTSHARLSIRAGTALANQGQTVIPGRGKRRGSRGQPRFARPPPGFNAFCGKWGRAGGNIETFLPQAGAKGPPTLRRTDFVFGQGGWWGEFPPKLPKVGRFMGGAVLPAAWMGEGGKTRSMFGPDVVAISPGPQL